MFPESLLILLTYGMHVLPGEFMVCLFLRGRPLTFILVSVNSTNAEANFIFDWIFFEEQYIAVSDKMRYWNIYI